MVDPSVPPAIQWLQQWPQWVCYPHSSKLPLNPHTGKGADCNDPTSWGTYEQARRTWASRRSWYAGLGFEFVKEQGITGIDLDKCVVDGEISQYACEVLAFLNSYAEFSPSGTGIHILVKGSLPDNLEADKKGDGDQCIEMYDHQRYFSVTGNKVPGMPDTIEDKQEELLLLYNETVERRRMAKAERSRRGRKRKSSAPAGPDSPYGLAAINKECTEVATTPEGSRNEQLNKSAFLLGQLVGGGELSRATVERELAAAAGRAGLPEREIEKTIERGIDAGLKDPRSKPVLHVVSQTDEESTGDNQQPAAASSDPPTSDLWLARFDADDAGNGDAVYSLYGKDFLWCGARGWFLWNGTHWALDTDGVAIKRRTVDTLRRRRHAAVDAKLEAVIKCCKADDSRVNGAISRFKTLVSVNLDAFDANPDLLNCKNGVVDLRTGQFVPHHRDQRFSYCLPVAYQQGADYTLWLDYLMGVVGGGEEVLDYLQKLCGYSLTGHTREEILIYLHGPTRSGKGTFAETFMSLLPDPIATMVDFNSFTAKREGDVSNFDLAPLKPCRMIFTSESQRNQPLNPAKIKQLTGGDKVRCCFKHREHFTYRPQFKAWMLSNWPVNGDPEDDAMWGRVRVIEFPNSFLGNEDKSKKENLKKPEVLQGVLWWAVQGAINWYALGAKGLTTPDTVEKKTREHRDELDYVQQWLDECCTDNEDGWVSNEQVSASYLEWCKSNNVQHPKGPKALAQSLKAKGYEPGKVKWIGGKTKRGVGGLYIYTSD